MCVLADVPLLAKSVTILPISVMQIKSNMFTRFPGIFYDLDRISVQTGYYSD